MASWGKVSNDVARLLREEGPHVAECFVCDRCGEEEYALHPFCESVECANCRHRNATEWYRRWIAIAGEGA